MDLFDVWQVDIVLNSLGTDFLDLEYLVTFFATESDREQIVRNDVANLVQLFKCH